MSDGRNKHELVEAGKLKFVDCGRGIVGDFETFLLQRIREVEPEIQLVAGVRFVHVQFGFHVVIGVRRQLEQRDVLGKTFSDDAYL